MTKKKLNSAKMLGKGLAILQHSFDKLFAWGFSEMKAHSTKTTKQKEGRVMKALRGLGGFLGIMGEEYYKKYEELKKKEK